MRVRSDNSLVMFFLLFFYCAIRDTKFELLSVNLKEKFKQYPQQNDNIFIVTPNSDNLLISRISKIRHYIQKCSKEPNNLQICVRANILCFK